MLTFFGTDLNPVGCKGTRALRAEARDHIKCQINRIELNMRKCMEKGKTSFYPARSATGHVPGQSECRSCGTGRSVRRGSPECKIKLTMEPGCADCLGKTGLFSRMGRRKYRDRRGSDVRPDLLPNVFRRHCRHVWCAGEPRCGRTFRFFGH